MKHFFVFIALVYYFSAQAQSYNTVVGLRFGDDLKFSVGQRIFNRTSLEANLSDGLFSDHKYASLAIKKHHPLITKRLNFFLGAGYYGQSALIENEEVPDFSFNNHGVLGTMGLEFTLGRINISMDYSPQYALSKNYHGRKLTADSALSVRYVLWKRKSKTLKKFFSKIF